MAGKKMGNKYLFTVYIRHALTVEGVMYWYAKEPGYGDEEKFWEIVGISHDINFEKYPDQHCIKVPKMLRDGGASEELLSSVVLDKQNLFIYNTLV